MSANRGARALAVLGLFGIATAALSADPMPLPKDADAKADVKLTPLEPPPGTILKPGECPIDLGTALRLAGVENPELLLARQRVVEATAARQYAAVQILPNINAGTNYDAHIGPLQQSTGNILKVNRDALYLGLGANAVAAGTVGIPGIYYNLNVGTSWFNFMQARQLVAVASAESAAVQIDVFLRVALAYSELLRAEGRRAVAERGRGEVAEVARLTASYTNQGQGRKADADRAAVELKRRDVELLQAESDVLTASARLARLLNLDPSTRLKPIDGWVVPAPVVPDPLPLSELIAIAVMQRPELAARRAEIRGAMYGLSAAKLLPFSPNVILGYSAGTFGGGSNLVAEGILLANGSTLQGPRFGNFNPRSDFDAVAYWTLQNCGVGNLALIRGARSRLRQSELRELETLNRVRTEVAEAHARTHAYFAQFESLEKAVKSSQEAYKEDLTRIIGRQGLPIEVIDSARLLNRARVEYLDAIVNYNRAQFQLYAALGRPPAGVLARPVPADLVPPPATVEQLPAPGPDVPAKP
jgi:outer membrane protein TolC